jgi:hypothetical protein
MLTRWHVRPSWMALRLFGVAVLVVGGLYR